MRNILHSFFCVSGLFHGEFDLHRVERNGFQKILGEEFHPLITGKFLSVLFYPDGLGNIQVLIDLFQTFHQCFGGIGIVASAFCPRDGFAVSVKGRPYCHLLKTFLSSYQDMIMNERFFRKYFMQFIDFFQKKYYNKNIP